MINKLLKLSDEDRKKLLKQLKTETKKRFFDKIYTMTEELGLDKIPDYETRVKMRYELIQKFPDVVFWDYPEYYGANQYFKFTMVKVSTNGDVVLIKQDGKSLFVYPNFRKTKNRYNKFNINKQYHSFHRTIAGTFIPRDNRVLNKPWGTLHVNHKRSPKNNNRVSNLEWVTCSENTLHGLSHTDYAEDEYYTLTVKVDNGFLNREFNINRKEGILLGLSEGELRTLSNLPNKTYFGFGIEKCKSIPPTTGIPNEILTLFNSNKDFFSTKARPYIGTILSGPYAGLEFSLIGREHINKYFKAAGIRHVLIGRNKHHKNCTFRRASLKESIPLYDKLTEEIAATLN